MSDERLLVRRTSWLDFSPPTEDSVKRVWQWVFATPVGPTRLEPPRSTGRGAAAVRPVPMRLQAWTPE